MQRYSCFPFELCICYHLKQGALVSSEHVYFCIEFNNMNHLCFVGRYPRTAELQIPHSFPGNFECNRASICIMDRCFFNVLENYSMMAWGHVRSLVITCMPSRIACSNLAYINIYCRRTGPSLSDGGYLMLSSNIAKSEDYF